MNKIKFMAMRGRGDGTVVMYELCKKGGRRKGTEVILRGEIDINVVREFYRKSKENYTQRYVENTRQTLLSNIE